MPRTVLCASALVLAGLGTFVAPAFVSVLADLGELVHLGAMDWMHQASVLALGA